MITVNISKNDLISYTKGKHVEINPRTVEPRDLVSVTLDEKDAVLTEGSELKLPTYNPDGLYIRRV